MSWALEAVMETRWALEGVMETKPQLEVEVVAVVRISAEPHIAVVPVVDLAPSAAESAD